MADLEACRAFGERFGWPTGRVIAEYPTQWIRLAYRHIDESSLQPVKKKSLKTRLNRMRRHLIRRAATDWHGDTPWVAQALLEHGRAPFRAIVTGGGGPVVDPVISWDTDDTEAGLWSVPSGVTVRSPEAIADGLALLAAGARRLLLVDPHFDPTAARFTATLRAMLVRLGQLPVRGTLPNVELHILLGSRRELRELDAEARRKRAEIYLSNCAQRLAPLIPANLQFSVVVWAEREHGQSFHNRYALTEHGGIALGTGLDAATDGRSETDDLHRLTRDQHQTRWASLTTTSATYDQLAEIFLIAGSAAPLTSLA